MYYHKRFQENQNVKKIEIRGKFSVIHLGGTRFVYTISRKNKSNIIKKIEFFEGNFFKYITLFFVFIFIFYFVFAKKGVAFTNKSNNFSKVEEEIGSKNLSPNEIEEETERLKNKILQEDEQIKKELENKKNKIISYIVKEGDTLNSISAKYQLPLKFILNENKLTKDSILKIGMNLRIPKKRGIIYSLRKGDRLADIAEKYQVKLEEIIEENDLYDYDLLEIGAKIFLPNAVIPEPPPVWNYPIVGRITSGYGMRPHPFFGFRQFHGGLDFSVFYAPVKAAREGVVYYAGEMGGYGLTIILKHGSDYKTLYAHLSRIHVKIGQYVKAGQVIGTSGNTGFSTGPHLHFEIIYKGTPINPLKYLK